MRTSEERAIVQAATSRLVDLLQRIRFLCVSKPISNTPGPGELFQIDGAIQVKHHADAWWLLLDVKSNAQLRTARLSIEYLQQMSKNLGTPAYGIFISQYLSQSIRDLCVENGIGYMDFSGNCWIAFDDVFIERAVPASETPERKRLQSLFSLKASRVIRRLLHDPGHLWKVQLLAEEAAVSPSTVSLVKDKLLSEEYAARQGEAFIISKPEQLLLDWAHNYRSRDHKQIECYGEGELIELENRFAKHCREKSIEYAFTLFSGARRVASFTRGVQRAYAYVTHDHDPLELGHALGLKQVDSGGNFRLLTPADNDLLYDKQDVAGDYVVSDIQLYLDLSGHPGRGEENAEFLLEKRIRPRW